MAVENVLAQKLTNEGCNQKFKNKKNIIIMLVVNPKRVTRNAAINPLFDNLFPSVKVSGVNRQFPQVNTLVSDAAFVLEVAAPGLKKEDFEIAIEENVLRIKGAYNREKQEGEKILRGGFSAYNFDRRFRLTDEIDVAEIVANYEAGVLKLTLPKKEKEAPIKIDIR